MAPLCLLRVRLALGGTLVERNQGSQPSLCHPTGERQEAGEEHPSLSTPGKCRGGSRLVGHDVVDGLPETLVSAQTLGYLFQLLYVVGFQLGGHKGLGWLHWEDRAHHLMNDLPSSPGLGLDPEPSLLPCSHCYMLPTFSQHFLPVDFHDLLRNPRPENPRELVVVPGSRPHCPASELAQPCLLPTPPIFALSPTACARGTPTRAAAGHTHCRSRRCWTGAGGSGSS
jgi:hypothetical protein